MTEAEKWKAYQSTYRNNWLKVKVYEIMKADHDAGVSQEQMNDDINDLYIEFNIDKCPSSNFAPNYIRNLEHNKDVAEKAAQKNLEYAIYVVKNKLDYDLDDEDYQRAMNHLINDDSKVVKKEKLRPVSKYRIGEMFAYEPVEIMAIDEKNKRYFCQSVHEDGSKEFDWVSEEELNGMAKRNCDSSETVFMHWIDDIVNALYKDSTKGTEFEEQINMLDSGDFKKLLLSSYENWVRK